MLRRLEAWLHQHIFKVGWLTTKDFQTTTILYYTFFLPGVVLHEVVYWLAAGLFNVRAEHAIGWPKAQDIGELKLNFVKLAPRSPVLRVAVIATMPLAAGLAVVWYIGNHVFGIPVVLNTITPVTLSSISTGIEMLLVTPDFWLWFYLAFTVANTMIPDLSKFTGYRAISIGVGIIVVLLSLIGLGNTLVLDTLGGPVATGLNILSGIFLGIIVMNTFMVGILAAVENTIEWITGDSADFRNGKMVTMTREERMEKRMREIEKQRQARQRKRSRTDTVEAGPPSIYKSGLPLPGGPEDTYVTPVQRVVEEKAETPSGDSKRKERGGASIISGELKEDKNRNVTSGGQTPQLPSSTGEAQ